MKTSLEKGILAPADGPHVEGQTLSRALRANFFCVIKALPNPFYWLSSPGFLGEMKQITEKLGVLTMKIITDQGMKSGRCVEAAPLALLVAKRAAKSLPEMTVLPLWTVSTVSNA